MIILYFNNFISYCSFLWIANNCIWDMWVKVTEFLVIWLKHPEIGQLKWIEVIIILYFNNFISYFSFLLVALKLWFKWW